jgi:nicotinate-nucleotide adenylyltransferase
VTVGLFGGTFDPPHIGHVALARTARSELNLDRLVVLVVGAPPHKAVETDAETRFRLAQAAFADLPGVEISRHELDRPGPSYTVETARWASAEFGDPVFIVGADEFADFLGWHEPNEILERVRLAVATRSGYDRARLEQVRSRLARPDRVAYFEFDPMDVASREIRARVANRESIEGLVPPAVAQLIDELTLYRRAA